MARTFAMIPFVFPSLFGITAATTRGISQRAESQTECYYPNGSFDPTHFPCTNSTTNTDGAAVCCAKDFQCASNGLCVDYRYPNFTRMLRGGCTDRNWGQGCPSICKEAWPDRDEAVFYCGDGKYCCDGDDCCQRAGASILQLGDPVVVAIARNTSEPGGTGTFSTMRLSMSPSSSPTGISSSNTPSSTPAPAQNSGTNSTAIGAGVGVGVGIVLVAVIVGFFVLRRRRQKAANTLNNTERSVADPSALPYEGSEADGYGQHVDMKTPNTVPHKVHEMPAFGEPKEVDGYGNEIRNKDIPISDIGGKEIYSQHRRAV